MLELAERAIHGRRLSVYLGDRLINVSALSRELNMDQSYLSKVFSGAIFPSRTNSTKIAEALGMSVGQLIDLIDARRQAISA